MIKSMAIKHFEPQRREDYKEHEGYEIAIISFVFFASNTFPSASCFVILNFKKGVSITKCGYQ
jgi:hypothetical protein